MLDLAQLTVDPHMPDRQGLAEVPAVGGTSPRAPIRRLPEALRSDKPNHVLARRRDAGSAMVLPRCRSLAPSSSGCGICTPPVGSLGSARHRSGRSAREYYAASDPPLAPRRAGLGCTDEWDESRSDPRRR